MASGRPRRPGIFGLIWNWRYELGCSAGWRRSGWPAWSGGVGHHGPFG
jgi:hypothetical protein